MADFSLILSGNEFKRVRTAAACGKSVHAYMLQGPDGIGKRSFALLLSAALLCPSAQPPCLECSVCSRVLAGLHPDVHIFTGAKKNISVGEVRTLTERSLESSYEGGRRVFIINNAHTMTQAAQNCLLKTLEEPEGSAVFILITSSPGAMLSTVRSRCRCIRIGERSAQDITAALCRMGYPEETARRAASVCGGNIGSAIAACSGSAGQSELALKLLESAERGSLSEVSALLSGCRDCLEDVLKNAESLLASRLESRPEDLRTLVLIKEINEALFRLRGNINYGLLTDRLALALTGQEVKWQR